jgi:hypothetical protein
LLPHLRQQLSLALYTPRLSAVLFTCSPSSLSSLSQQVPLLNISLSLSR